MRTSKKVISVILSLVMVLSMAATALAGTLRTDTYNTVEKLIQNDSLGNVLESLVTDINNKKADLAGTVLRLVLTFINNDSINAAKGDTDIATASGDTLATILLNWLDANLPEWTKDITNQSWYGPVSNLVKVIGITLDLKSVNGVIKTVYSLCDKADDKIFGRPVLNLGIANDLNGSALKNLSRGSGDMNVIYGLLQWLKDNMGVVKKALNGNLSLGIVSNFVDLGDVENSLKNIPLFVKSYLYQLIDGHAAAGKFSKDANEAKGDWGKSEAYKDFTADELLAVALLKLIKEADPAFTPGDVDNNGEIGVDDARYALRAAVGLDIYEPDSISFLAADTDGSKEIEVTDARNILRCAVGLPADMVEAPAGGEVIVTKDDADAALGLSVYELLATYADDLYSKYAIKAINDNLPKFISDISVTDEIKAVFKEEIPTVDKNTIADEIKGAEETGVLGQLNNLLVKLAELILVPDEFAKLGLTKGVNAGNLNANLEKIFRLILPLMANKTVSDNLGFDFTGFTADKVKDMATEDMAVAVLKLFFNGWFGSSPTYNAKAVADAATLEQLAVQAVYYTATNTGWLNVDYDFSGFAAQIFDGDKVNAFTSSEATALGDAIGIGIGAGALLHNSGTTNYRVPEEAATWTTEQYADDISDWALNYVKGVPAVIKAKGVSIDRSVYDPYQDNVYNKVSLVLNQLIDFRFLSNVGREGYTLALDTLVNDALLGNILDFDVEGLLAIFEKNDNEGNLFNKPYTVISAALAIVDRAVSCLFNVQ